MYVRIFARICIITVAYSFFIILFQAMATIHDRLFLAMILSDAHRKTPMCSFRMDDNMKMMYQIFF